MIASARAAFVVVVALAVAGAVACGGSSKTDTSATATAAVATATGAGRIPPLGSIGDPESVALVDQRGALYKFTLSLPQDWKPGDSSSGLDVFDVPNPGAVNPNGGEARAGYVTVECGPPKAPDGETEYTSGALARAAMREKNGGANPNVPIVSQADEASIHGVQIGALNGATLISTFQLAGLAGRVNNVYIATPTCAWHLAITILAPGDETPYFDLFDRIAETFRPDAAA